MILIIQVSDIVSWIGNELRVLEMRLELGYVHFFKWTLLNKFVELPSWSGEVQCGRDDH